MKDEILFSEQQRFKQWWFWIIFIGIDALFIIGSYQQIIQGQQFGDKPMGNGGLIFVTILLVLLTLVFAYTRLETQIKEDGIYVRFFPFRISFKHYPWDKLTKSFVRKYRPLVEYGGWGLRFSVFGYGTAYNVSGNMGLQLIFTNRKKLLIGTQKPEELTEALNKIGQLKK